MDLNIGEEESVPVCVCPCASSEYKERGRFLKNYAEGEVWAVYAVSHHR